MNRGIMLKSIREVLPVTLLLGLLLLVFEALLGYVLPTFQRQFSAQIYRLEFVRTIVQALLGTELAEGLGPMLFTSMAWVHPVVLALVWAHAIIVCTRVPAGEVDRGTIDVLLGLPVSRWSLYITESAVWLFSTIVLLLFALAGNVLGTWRIPPEFRAEPEHILIVLINLLCVIAAVGSAAWCLSALSDRRGRAMGTAFVLVTASFLLNYLAQFWEPARQVAFLGMLRYYRPLFVLRDGTWPLRDIAVLLTAAGVLWTAGGIIFARRDLSTL